MRKIIPLIILCCLLYAIGDAQPGRLDSTFGINGVIKTTRPSGNRSHISYKTIALQQDGKIVVAGNAVVTRSDIVVARYTANGRPDSTFDGDGTNTTVLPGNLWNQADAVAIQPDGKILIAGYSISASSEGTLLLARYNANGSLDRSFDGDGYNRLKVFERSFPGSIAMQNDGKIVVAGFAYDKDTAKIILVRCNKNGSLDRSFGNNGIQANIPGLLYSMIVDGDGKIVILALSASRDILVRYNPDGMPDSSFSGDGIQQIILGSNISSSALALQGDGKLMVAGKIFSGSNEDIFIARYNKDGTIDAGFGDGGTQISDFAPFDYLSSIEIQPNGKIVIAGGVIARYNGDGILEEPFDHQQKQIKEAFKSRYIFDISIRGNRLYATGEDQAAGKGVVAAYLLDSRPTVVLSTRGNYLAGGNVYLTAAVSDADGTVSKVEFYNGKTLLHTATDTPYTFKWPKVKRGNYSLTAKAISDDGRVTTSNAVQISVVPNKAPEVNIISPVNGERFAAYSTINLEATARDTDGRITVVEFYSGTSLLAIERKIPYTYRWVNVPPGNYTITAVARDNWGATTVSQPVMFTVLPREEERPTFGFNFNGTLVSNVNNNYPDPTESASVTVCDGGLYETSGHFHSSPRNLYYLTITSSGSALLFNGIQSYSAVITAAELTASAGIWRIDLVNPDTAGTLIQTVTPFKDLNNNRRLDAGDLAGDPIRFTHTATPKPTWYKDADGDGHAFAKMRSCSSPGAGWTITQLPVDDCNDNDASISRPAFGFNFNGKNVFNISNGLSDDAESASAILCDGAQFTESGLFYNSRYDLFDLAIVFSGAKPRVDGVVGANAVVTAARLKAVLEGAHTVTLDNPDIGGTFVQTLTPFTDINGNGRLDAADCAGDPIVLTLTAVPKLTWYKDADGDGHAVAKTRSCSSPGAGWTITRLAVDDCNDNDANISRPAFGFNFNGKNVFNISNGLSDDVESAGVILCDGAQFTESGLFYSSAYDLFDLAIVFSGAKPRVDGVVGANAVVTGARLKAVLEGVHTATLDNPYVGGTFVQTLTPFTDINQNGKLDAADCAGDPIKLTYTVEPCGAKKLSVQSGKASREIEGAIHLKLSPNPAKNILNVYTSGWPTNKRMVISVISAQGAVMKTLTSDDQVVQLDVSSMASGMYTLRIAGGDKVMYSKFVKL